MQRKVVKQGPNTLMVSIPRKWAESNKISKGDSLEVAEEKAFLTISKGDVKEGVMRTELKIEKGYTKNFVRALISNLYKKGHDLIEIEFENDSNIEAVQRAVNTLIGYEITSQSKDKITVQNVSKEMDKEFESYLRKSFFMILEMARITEEDISSGKYGSLSQMEQMADSIAKFTDICKRALNKHAVHKYADNRHYLIAWGLEKTCREYLYLYRRAASKKPKLKKNSIEFFRKANAYFRSYYENFYEIKARKLDDFVKEKEALYYTDSYNLLSKSSDPVIIMHSANIIRMIFNMTNPLIGLEKV